MSVAYVYGPCSLIKMMMITKDRNAETSLMVEFDAIKLMGTKPKIRRMEL